MIDLRSLAPLDDDAIVATVKKTNRVLIVHEDTRTGGIAGEITARINESCFEWLDAPVLRVTAHDVPLPYAPSLEDFVLPQTADIVLGGATPGGVLTMPMRDTDNLGRRIVGADERRGLALSWSRLLQRRGRDSRRVA